MASPVRAPSSPTVASPTVLTRQFQTHVDELESENWTLRRALAGMSAELDRFLASRNVQKDLIDGIGERDSKIREMTQNQRMAGLREKRLKNEIERLRDEESGSGLLDESGSGLWDADLDEENEMLRAQVEKLKAENEEMAKDLEELGRSAEAVIAENVALKEKSENGKGDLEWEELRAENEKLAGEVDELNSDNEKLRDEIDEMNSENEVLKGELRELRNGNEGSNELADENDRLKDEIGEMADENDGLRGELDDLKGDNEELKDRNQKLQGENGELMERLSNRAQLDVYVTKMLQVTNCDDIDSLVLFVSEIVGENMRERVNELEDEIERLRDENEYTKEEVARLRRQLGVKQIDMMTSPIGKGGMDVDVDAIMNENQTLKAENINIRAQNRNYVEQLSTEMEEKLKRANEAVKMQCDAKHRSIPTSPIRNGGIEAEGVYVDELMRENVVLREENENVASKIRELRAENEKIKRCDMNGSLLLCENERLKRDIQMYVLIMRRCVAVSNNLWTSITEFVSNVSIKMDIVMESTNRIAWSIPASIARLGVYPLSGLRHDLVTFINDARDMMRDLRDGANVCIRVAVGLQKPHAKNQLLATPQRRDLMGIERKYNVQRRETTEQLGVSEELNEMRRDVIFLSEQSQELISQIWNDFCTGSPCPDLARLVRVRDTGEIVKVFESVRHLLAQQPRIIVILDNVRRELVARMEAMSREHDELLAMVCGRRPC